ncbi:MAG: TetR/AcrR family transcriptional regulator [Actinomycetota bacterium]
MAADRAAKRRAQRRDMIIAAAEEELAVSGLAGTTLAGVGDRVGLSKGALYYYVSSRDELLALVLSVGLEDIQAEAAAEAGPDAAPVDELRSFGRAHVRLSVERPSGQLIIGNLDYLAATDATADLMHEHEAVVRGIVERAVEADQLRPVHPVVASATFFGAMNTIARTFDPTGDLSLVEMTDAALDLLLGGWCR